MLWLGLYLPQLPLEVFAPVRRQAGPLAIVESSAGRERISRCSAVAQAHGLQPGMLLPTALALCAGLAVRRRAPDREHRALEGLAAWAYQFSSCIAFEPSLLLLEIGASRRLFGDLAALQGRIRCGVEQLGYRVRDAVAPTALAAGLLARNRAGCRVCDRDELRRVVGDLPLACLTRDVGARDLIRHIGLETLGEVLALPRPELVRRVGPRLALLLDRLLGLAPDPRAQWQPPRHFAQTLELLGEIGQTSALVFPARRLLLALCGFLHGCGGGAQRLHWTLAHRDRPDTDFDQGLLDPSRDPDHMLAVFRERIERLQLPAPVIGLGLRVDDWQPLNGRSHELFVGSADVGQTDSRVAGQMDSRAVDRIDKALLERLANRLGEQRVRGLRCLADHRPEYAWGLCAPGEMDAEVAAGDTAARRQGLSQPPWLLAQPQPLPAPQGLPRYGGALQLADRPERIETGWWDGRDIARDYFVAQGPAGECLWVFRDRRDGGWYLHGFFV